MLSKEELELRAKWPDGSFDKEAAIELLSLRKQLDDMREFVIAVRDDILYPLSQDDKSDLYNDTCGLGAMTVRLLRCDNNI